MAKVNTTKLLPRSQKSGDGVSNNLANVIEATVVIKRTTINLEKFYVDRKKRDEEAAKKAKREQVILKDKERKLKRESTIEKKTTALKKKEKGKKVSAGSFGNILDALVLLALGWLIKFIPDFIKRVEIFIANVKSVFSSIKTLITQVGTIFKGIYAVAAQAVENIRNFDFFDKEGKLQEKIDEMNGNFDKLEKDWQQLEKDVKKLADEVMAELPEEERSGSIDAVSSGDLFDVIAAGEGGYNSVNQGTAGDTPGGAMSVVGKNLTDMTVREVVTAQQSGQLFAVGKYQIIPDTMVGFISNSPDPIDMNDKFDAETQEKFKRYIMDVKRPAVGRYIRGESDNRTEAAQELAREFASVGLAAPEAGRQRGESRYSGTGGNRASITPESIEGALDRARSGVSQGASQTPATSSPNSLGLVNPTPKTNLKTQKGGYAADTGLDIHGNIGDPIVAPASGILEYAEEGHTAQSNQDSNPNKPGFQPQHSFRIKLDNPFTMGGKTVRFIYGTHLETLDPAVANRTGIKIRAGQRLGTMGVANNVPHLHLGLVGDRAQTEFLNFKEVDSALGGRFSSSSPSLAPQQARSRSISRTMEQRNGLGAVVIGTPKMQPAPSGDGGSLRVMRSGGTNAVSVLNSISRVILAYT